MGLDPTDHRIASTFTEPARTIKPEFSYLLFRDQPLRVAGVHQEESQQLTGSRAE